MKIMVAYDGTLQAKEALAYGIEKARTKGGEMVALQVFDSPMFADYDATVNTRAAARAEATRFADEAKAIIREKGKKYRARMDLLALGEVAAKTRKMPTAFIGESNVTPAFLAYCMPLVGTLPVMERL